jgi:anti-sigma factor RsiW
MITCRELIEFLIDYTDGQLPEEARREFERHLAVCPSCVAYLKSYLKTIELGREAMGSDDQSVPAGMPESLVRAVMAGRVGRADAR